MQFAKRLYLIAGIYGLLGLLPQYFLEERVGRDLPPPVTHPEYFYGFIGVAVAWQVAFLIISRDPVRYRMLMLPTILEKASFGLAVIALFAIGRVNGVMLAPAAVDLLLGALFAVSFVRTGAAPGTPPA